MIRKIMILRLYFLDSKNINDTSIRNIFMDFIIKISNMNLDNMFMNNMNMLMKMFKDYFLRNSMNIPMNNNNINIDMLMNMFMNMFMNNNNMNMFMNMFMNNNNMNMFMNNNNMNMFMNMFMNNNNMNMFMNMFMNNNNMNMLMDNNNMLENLNNQTFFEYVYDRFIFNDKDNYNNNIEKTFIYNNFLNFIDYLKINDINLYSKFINLRNYFIFNKNNNNNNFNLNVKKEDPIFKDFYQNYENKKINFIFQLSNGFRTILPTPLDVTFDKLIKNFKNAFGSSSNFVFIHNATKLNIEDNRPIKDIFKLEFNEGDILINVFDDSFVIGA